MEKWRREYKKQLFQNFLKRHGVYSITLEDKICIYFLIAAMGYFLGRFLF